MTRTRTTEDPGVEVSELARHAEALPAAPIDADAIFHGIQGRIAQSEREPTWWLRTRSTRLRRSIAIGAALFFVALGLLTGVRPDLAVYPLFRMTASTVALVGMLLVCLH